MSGAFWAFTLESYPREGVQQAVIALQDRCGADVNLLLFCCYVAASGRGDLDGKQLAAADQAIAPWRSQVTQPLRGLRDHIKETEALWTLAGAQEARGKVLGAEIESERVAQGVLEGLAPAATGDSKPPESRARDAAASLERYFQLLSVEPGAADRQALRTLLRGTFPDLSQSELDQAFGAAF